jgi:hypothetical protein
MKLFRVHSMYPMTPMHPMSKDLYIEKCKKIMRHQIDQHEQEVVVDALIYA